MAFLLQNFNQPKMGGSTTPPYLLPTFQPTAIGTPSTIQTGFTPKVASPALGTIGTQAKSPYDNIQLPTNSLPTGQIKTPTQPNGGIDYTLHPGESIGAYNARIATARTSQTTPIQGTSGGNTTVATPPPNTGQAPSGMEYGPTGQLQQKQTTSPPVVGSTITGYDQGGNPIYRNPIPSADVTPNPYGATTPYPTNPNAQNPAPTPYTPNAGLYGQLITGLANTPQTNTAVQNAIGNLSNLQSDYAGKIANIESNPLGLSEQQGSEGILNRLFAVKYQAGQQAVQSALQAQELQQQALGTAGGLVAPQQVSPANIPFSPMTGQYGTPAAIAYGAGGLQNIGGILQQEQIGANVAQLNSYLGGAQVVGNNLNDLITQNSINPMGLTYANGAFQFAANVMSDPAYRKFAGQINDFVSSLAPILGVGGNVTDMKTQMSNQIVNGLQSGSTIKDVVNYFLQQAQQKIQGLSAGGGVSGVQPQTPLGGSAAIQGGNTLQQVGGYNYKQNPDGSWSLVQ